MRKENKNNDFIQPFVSSASTYSTILESAEKVYCSVFGANKILFIYVFLCFIQWGHIDLIKGKSKHICIVTKGFN